MSGRQRPNRGIAALAIPTVLRRFAIHTQVLLTDSDGLPCSTADRITTLCRTIVDRHERCSKCREFNFRHFEQRPPNTEVHSARRI